MEPRGRILVVDDEVNARTALAELLRDEGYTVETAADGFKALPKLEDFSPDLVVTDLRMPGMDGLQLLKKAHEREPDCAVIVMTAYGAVDTAGQMDADSAERRQLVSEQLGDRGLSDGGWTCYNNYSFFCRHIQKKNSVILQT